MLSDQADPAASRALADDVAARHGRIDILFVNAGVAAFSPLEQLTEEVFDRQFDINVRGALFAAKAAAPHIPEGGTIIFTASTAASSGMAAGSVYAASKAAVRSFARSLGAELAPKGVRVNVISPGPIETPIFGKSGASAEQIEGFKSSIVSGVPLGRIGRPEEIAAAVLFLAADATFVTGEEIVSGGGLWSSSKDDTLVRDAPRSSARTGCTEPLPASWSRAVLPMSQDRCCACVAVLRMLG